MRADGRELDQLREVRFTRNFTQSSQGSVLVEFGRTRVLCTANLLDGVPPFMLNTNRGWLTAEYSMLPGSTQKRRAREGRKPGSIDARSLEISRMIGRSLRAACNFKRLPGRTVWVDCDVLEADGGTRTASITGAMIALNDAFRTAERNKWLRGWPILSPVAAISAGMVDGKPVLDLDYAEDSRADTDLNVVRNSKGEYVEIAGAAEGLPLSRASLNALLDLCDHGTAELFKLQDRALDIRS